MPAAGAAPHPGRHAADVAVVAGTSGVDRADASTFRALDRARRRPRDPPASADRAPRRHRRRGRVGVRSRRRSPRRGAPRRRRAARWRAARAHGVLYGAAEPYARLVHEHCSARGHPAQRRGGAHARRRRARARPPRAARARRPRLPPPRRDGSARVRSRASPRARRCRRRRWERDQPRRGDRARRRAVAGAARRGTRPHARALDSPRNARCPTASRVPSATSASSPPPASCRPSSPTSWAHAAVAPGHRWSELAAWAHRSRARPPRAACRSRTHGPSPSSCAADKVEAVLDRLAGLDAVEDAPGRRGVPTHPRAGARRRPRSGRSPGRRHPHGPRRPSASASTSTASSCAGSPKARFPARVRDDSLLPDADRRATNGVLPLRAGAGRRRPPRASWPRWRAPEPIGCCCSPAAISAAPPSACRRGSCSTRSTRSTAARRESPTSSTNSASTGTRPVPSFAAGIARVAFPATEQEYRLRSLLDSHAGRAGVLEQSSPRTTSRSAAGSTRPSPVASSEFTRFDGNLARACRATIRPTPTSVVSPTRLQTYASCPFEYFLDYVLRVEIPDLPEERYELSPLDRGSLVHETLDQFLREVLARPDGRAGAGHRVDRQPTERASQELGEAQCAVYEAQGLTGRRLFWHRDRRRILADLDRFLSADDDACAPATACARSPPSCGSASRRERAPGRARAVRRPELRFRGAADRVDRTADGGALGHRLQDRLATRDRRRRSRPRPAPCSSSRSTRTRRERRSATPPTPVGASYWYVSTKGGFRWAELSLTPEVDARVDEVLRAIADGIDAGAFPCRVDPPSTWTRRFRSYADPDARGHARPLPRVAAQARRPRTRRLRRDGRTRDEADDALTLR